MIVVRTGESMLRRGGQAVGIELINPHDWWQTCKANAPQKGRHLATTAKLVTHHRSVHLPGTNEGGCIL